MAEEKKTKTTAPKKPRVSRVKILEEELAKATEVAQGNLEYAKKANDDADKAYEQVAQLRQIQKELIDTVSQFLTTLDNISVSFRKALAFTLNQEKEKGE